MNIFNFNVSEILTFFGVLVRFSVLIAVLPIFGNKLIPGPVKVLLSLVVSMTLFPVLVATGQIQPKEALVWGNSASGIVSVVGLEALTGLILGYTAKLVFDGVGFGANLVGNLMGFAAASIYDPHQESQTEVIAQIQTTLAMLLFLTLDGHLFMLKTSLDSYRILGMGKAAFGMAVTQRLVQMTGEVLRFGIQLSAPVAIAIFSVNLVFGVIAKALPQINILVLSFSVTALVGFAVLFLSASEFFEESTQILAKGSGWIEAILTAMARGA